MKRIELTTDNVSTGLKVICRDSEDWGTWRILNCYDSGIWEIRGDTGDRVLFEKEFKFWDIVGGI